MRNTRQRDTPFEISVRRLLHARGLRYRVDLAIPAVTRARPDVVFRRERVAVFLDGCFWHSCPQHATTPTANRDWWRTKLLTNVERDRRHDRELAAAGWTVRRFWEHEEAAFVATEIEQLVLRRRKSSREPRALPSPRGGSTIQSGSTDPSRTPGPTPPSKPQHPTLGPGED